MARVKIYSTGICPICDNTKNLLKKWGIPFEESRVDRNRDELKEMLKITDGARTVPQIVIDGEWIGGFTDLTEMHMDGKLKHLINPS
jgi:glutaredoxin 3